MAEQKERRKSEKSLSIRNILFTRSIRNILFTRFTANATDGRRNLRSIYEDEDVVVATDGKVLVEIDTEIYPDAKGIGGLVDGYPNYKGVLPALQTDPIIFLTSELSFPSAGVDDLDKECPECKGRGHTDHVCDCEHCDLLYEDCEACLGAGCKMATPNCKEYVKFNHQYFNAYYMHQVGDLLRALDIKQPYFHQHPESERRALLITSEGVKILVSPFLSGYINPEEEGTIYDISGGILTNNMLQKV